MKLGGKSYTTAATRRSYAPNWEQPIAIDARTLLGNEKVVIQLIDATDDSLIGQRETTAAELLATSSRTLTNIGPVASLDVSVEPMAPRALAQYEIRFPPKRRWTRCCAGSPISGRPFR